MTSEVLKISPRETVMQALLLMMDTGIHHLPVVDGERPVGLLTSSDIFNAENDQPVFLLQRIRRQNSVEKLIPVIQDRAELFANLEAMGASAEQMGQFMTAVIDGATRRLLQLAEEKLGPPPLPYCWLCFGSQARAEQSIKTDQDNGLLLAEEPDPDQAEYFVKLAAFVCDGLNAAGIIWCPGDVMAKNPQWRMSLAGWQQQFFPTGLMSRIRSP